MRKGVWDTVRGAAGGEITKGCRTELWGCGVTSQG